MKSGAWQGPLQQRTVRCGPWAVVATEVVQATGTHAWDVNATHDNGGRLYPGENLHAHFAGETSRIVKLIDYPTGAR